MLRILFFLWLNTLAAFELSIVTMFKNEAPYLKEWIEFHRMAGVEHFWMYDNGSTDNWKEVLDPYIQEGVIEVTYWPCNPDYNDWEQKQIGAFQDGMKRACGRTTWVTMIDIDEFLFPRKNRTILECLNEHFSNVSAIFVNWRNFGTGGVFINKGDPILFRLTACSLPSSSDNSVGKSIVRPEHVDIDSVWYPHHFPLKAGCKYANGDGQPLIFKETNLETNGKHHSKFLCLNHYVLRDENFYRNSRLPKTKNRPLLEEHYVSFSLTKDFSIINYIKRVNPE